MPDPPHVDPSVSDDPEPLPQDVLWGLIYTHDRANANTAGIERIAAALEGLVNLLVDRGVVTMEEVDAAAEAAADDVRARLTRSGAAVLREDHDISKYAFAGGAPIDCASRVHLCRAACCRFRVVLSTEDVREGVLRWDPAAPYALAKRRDGSCVHMNAATCGCEAYARRPMACRAFDCRNDPRIWVDFEAREPHPLLHDPDWPDVVSPVP